VHVRGGGDGWYEGHERAEGLESRGSSSHSLLP
jgi:hypothetical protein